MCVKGEGREGGREGREGERDEERRLSEKERDTHSPQMVLLLTSRTFSIKRQARDSIRMILHN